MNISNLILAGNYVEAKNQISERLNEIALGLMESAKEVYAQHLFIEEFDAKFKGKTDMDFVKDAKKEGDEDEGDGDAPHGEMPVGDEQDEGESEEPAKDEGEEESDEEPEGEEESDEKPAKNIKAGKGENINITVNEAHELHEVSKALLGRYIKKASKDVNDKSVKRTEAKQELKQVKGMSSMYFNKPTKEEKVNQLKGDVTDSQRDVNNRLSGISTAVSKIKK